MNQAAKYQYREDFGRVWREKRNEVLAHYGRICSIDGCSDTKNLNVHHKYYEPGKEPWDYPMDCYQVLCDKHHAKIHGRELKKQFCENPQCPTHPTKIRSCYTRCFPCNQALKEELIKKDDELRKQIKSAQDANARRRKQTKLINERDKLIHHLQKIISDLQLQLNDLLESVTSKEEKKQYESDLKKLIQLKEKYDGDIIITPPYPPRETKTFMKYALLAILALVVYVISTGVQQSTPIIVQMPPKDSGEHTLPSKDSGEYTSFRLDRSPDFIGK